MYVCMYVCMCVCVCIYIYIIINIKVYHKKFPQFRTNYSWFQTLISIKKKKHTQYKKQKAYKLPLHTKKTNNTNKLSFCPNKNSKITKLKKKKKLFSVPAGIARNWLVRPVFFPVRNRGVERTGLLAGTVRNR